MTEKRSYQPFVELLRKAGLRPTRQRLGLAKLLFKEGDRHVTAEILHGEAHAQRLKVSLATVYNTLNQFTEAGLLREVMVEPGCSYFDTNRSAHHHFYHEGNRQLTDIPGDAMQLGALPAVPHGSKVERVDVIIRLKDA